MSPPHLLRPGRVGMREVISSVPLIGGVIAPYYQRDAVGRVVVEDGLGLLLRTFLFVCAYGVISHF
jgi:hypothetical protein